jgi:uncharacterized protein YbaR (Trm112 family)
MTEVICPLCHRPLRTIKNQLAWSDGCLIAECESCDRRYTISVQEVSRGVV